MAYDILYEKMQEALCKQPDFYGKIILENIAGNIQNGWG